MAPISLSSLFSGKAEQGGVDHRSRVLLDTLDRNRLDKVRLRAPTAVMIFRSGHEREPERSIEESLNSGKRQPMSAPSPDAGPRLPNATRGAIVAILLALFALQVLLTSRQMSPAYDEVAILPVGYVFLKTGQWRLVPEHPPLIFAFSALPLLALKPHLDLTDPSWARGGWTEGVNIWRSGANFFMTNDADRLLLWGRLPTLLLALLLAYFVYRWAKELYGGKAGLMALLLYAFCPLTIANSGFASYDVGLSCFYTLSLYSLWRFMTKGTWRRLLWTGLLLGCALASKTPAVILPPVFAVLMLLAVWYFPRGEEADTASPATASSPSFPLAANTVRERLPRCLTALSLIFLMALGVLYTVYLFPKDPLFYVRAVLLAPRLHPHNYLWYVMGQFRAGGWWYYFLVAFVIKTPIPLLLLILIALWHWRRQGGGWFNEAFLLLPALALFTLISALADPLNLRYLLPIYPLLFIFASRTAQLLTQRLVGLVAGIVLAAWYLSTPIRIYPDYLAYFNEFIGGPKFGLEYLDADLADWGQNLKRLKRYLDAHQFNRVKLLYVGEMRPEYYGIHAEPMQFADMARKPEPGVYIISAHGLMRARALFGIDWLKRYNLVDVIGYSFYVFRVS